MDSRAITRILILVSLPLSLALFAGPAESRAATNLDFSSATQSSAGSGLAAPHFAIGDFDGDQKPDFATVQVDPYTQRDSRYSIHLQLSFGASSAIGLTAPFGGLLLSAKDVNGDSAVDLVVTTVVDHKFVTVLVNDGRGNFSFAEGGAFPELSSESGVHMDAQSAPSWRQLALSQSRCPSGQEASDAAEFHSAAPSEWFLTANQQDFSRRHLGASLGRSPPKGCILP